jgi:hypothetical protein
MKMRHNAERVEDDGRLRTLAHDVVLDDLRKGSEWVKGRCHV